LLIAPGDQILLPQLVSQSGGFASVSSGISIPADGLYKIIYQVTTDSIISSVIVHGTSSGYITSTAFGNDGGGARTNGSAIVSLEGGEVITLLNNSTVATFDTVQSPSTTLSTIPVEMIVLWLQ
jgi:hypothetical protein